MVFESFRDTTIGVNEITDGALFYCASMYTVVGVTGFVVFGDEIEGNFLLHLPKNSANSLMLAGKD